MKNTLSLDGFWDTAMHGGHGPEKMNLNWCLKKDNHLNKTFLWCSSQDLQGYQIALFGRSVPEFLQYAYSSWKTMQAVVSLAKRDHRLCRPAQTIAASHVRPPYPPSEHFDPAKELWMIPLKGLGLVMRKLAFLFLASNWWELYLEPWYQQAFAVCSAGAPILPYPALERRKLQALER